MLRAWRLDGVRSTVYNFFDEEQPESADDKLQRHKNCSMSECSDPDYWHWVHYGGNNPGLSDEDFVGDYITNREALLKRARDSWEEASAHSDYERMYHYDNVINTLTTL